ncbi:hypothetical protein PAXINDRAFT_21290 [Paxillus involutus ATCC 200175]|uniref:Uncharacterized protein n=1 Tax=Paxillus involutus ATCC 200175 TaxID=664439 RepID=A0A0C9TB72_PAXIN|nr:hypothetical protein PAXINDRAFT_21290 [Paxillus involutus ATCC 200175]
MATLVSVGKRQRNPDTAATAKENHGEEGNIYFCSGFAAEKIHEVDDDDEQATSAPSRCTAVVGRRALGHALT